MPQWRRRPDGHQALPGQRLRDLVEAVLPMTRKRRHEGTYVAAPAKTITRWPSGASSYLKGRYCFDPETEPTVYLKRPESASPELY